MRLGKGWVTMVGVVGAAALLAALTYIPHPGGRGTPPGLIARAANGGITAPTVDQAATSGLGQQRTSSQEVERLIHAYEARVATNPDPLEFTFLGRLYLERARTTGDVASFVQAETALGRALEMYPTDPEAGTMLASALFATHDFAGAMAQARRIYDRDPTQLAALAVIGDAQQELGDYAAAATTYAQLRTEAPDAPAVNARLARYAYLHGDGARAQTLAARAFEEASTRGSFGAELAWYRTLQGQIALDAGRYTLALRLYRQAVAIAPDYHVARAGLARALAASGQLHAAIASYREAITMVPQPSYLAALGDLYVAIGHADRAADPYATVRVIASLSATTPHVYDRQLALFDADHDRRIAQAVSIAETSLRTRHDIYGYDTYAWALYRAGRSADARVASDQALALGTRDARLLFHAGMISEALGDNLRAARELTEALAVSPNFDPLLAPLARRTLASLVQGAAA
jgi:tetratricopeptide (TPR) repeat protein